MSKVRFGNRSFNLPANRILRIGMGIGLIFLGILGSVLPVLGVWMIPLGLLVLSVDMPLVRRLNRRASVAVSRWWSGRKSRRNGGQAADDAAPKSPHTL